MYAAAALTEPTVLTYQKQFDLKYGCNPHQLPAFVSTRQRKPKEDNTDMTMSQVLAAGKDPAHRMPFEVVNGKPGYINLCDALNAWQLVKELRESLKQPAAASFKHVSPAGAAIGVPLTDTLKQAYEVSDEELTPLALAYLRARNADPKSSFGDFIALSDKVDVCTAKIIKTRVSDGVIAPDYEAEAIDILSKKKGGRYCILKADPDYSAPELEHREIYGLQLTQKRNTFVTTVDNSLKPEQLVTKNKELSTSVEQDLIIAAIGTKYTQSNSVAFALGGQLIGVGAGQQSRVDCVRLARRKAEIWYLRQHPKVLALKFKEGVKRVGRTNARIAYIEGDMTKIERAAWEENFEEVPEDLTLAEQQEFIKTLDGVSLFSDAFFPFRDNIDQASKVGVKYMLTPGGSNRDADVIEACDEYGMVMAFNGHRSFHH